MCIVSSPHPSPGDEKWNIWPSVDLAADVAWAKRCMEMYPNYNNIRLLLGVPRVPLNIKLKLEGGPGTSFEIGELAKQAARSGKTGQSHYFHGFRFLMDASRMKNARPQAQRLVLAWCEFSRAVVYPDCPENCVSDCLPTAMRFLREGFETDCWLQDIDEPCRDRLARAKTRKQIHAVSKKAVAGLSEFRDVFDLSGRDSSKGLDVSVFMEPWCIGKIEEYLGFWRDQLMLIELRLAEHEQ